MIKHDSIQDMTDLCKFYSLFSVSSSSSSSSVSSTEPLPIGSQAWKIAEDRIWEILSVVEPTAASEQRRKEIIEYIQVLFEDSFAIKVLPLGSVPLKTYLPDGDVDFTALCPYDAEYLAVKFCSLLQNEAKYYNAMRIRDAQSIPAQVKLVKCTVGNIAVDISFNQLAGLCALSFLEQVDQFIGKENLFKRCVILIKAWCFYESRILGAHCGLIATYALETMILHIMNLFHSSLHSPLAVLYKFLSYYSKFKWKSYCVSLNGLLLISSLPEIVVKPPIDCDEVLLNNEFLRRCREATIDSIGVLQSREQPFSVKYLNIMDPLNDNNNLGRSINKGTYCRIRSAFKLGLSRLEELLMQPPESIANGLETFFATTLARNGRGRRSDVLVPVLEYGAARSEVSDPNKDNRNVLSGIQYGLWFHEYGMAPSLSKTSSSKEWKVALNPMWQSQVFDEDIGSHMIDVLLPLVDSPRHIQVTNGTVVERKGRSRGTGPYIPFHSQLQRRDRYFGQRRCKRLGSQVSRPSADGTPSSVWDASSTVLYSDPTDMASETEMGGERICTNLLLEGFPLLPGSKPSPEKVCPIAWQLRETSTASENIEFGTLNPAPMDVPLPLPNEQRDSEFSVIVNTSPSVSSAIGTMEQQEGSTVNEKEKYVLPSVETEFVNELPYTVRKAGEETVSMPSFLLRDDNFPPLVTRTREEVVIMPPLELRKKDNPIFVPKIEEMVIVPPFELSNENEFPPLLSKTKIEVVLPRSGFEYEDQFPPLPPMTEEEVVVSSPIELKYRMEFPPLMVSVKPGVKIMSRKKVK
ncbi:hypothetical protein Dimus_022488 [Dionaea muscipula]